jgi:glycosyltransferase involved in cell wall biosynthesis
VDTQRFTPESVNAGNRELGFRGIIVARYSLQKNVFLPIKWAAAHNRCPISFTWYGSEMCSEEGESVTLYQKAQAKLRDLNITTIKLCGSASNIENEYRRHDFLCLPSFYEGTANVICEGMACGLPILCSNISDNPSLVKEGVNGFLFDPTSLDSFDAAIGRFLKLRPEEFNRMRQVNRAKAVAWFSPDRFLDQWEAVIKSAQNPSKEQRTNTAAFAERCDAGSNNRNCS